MLSARPSLLWRRLRFVALFRAQIIALIVCLGTAILNAQNAVIPTVTLAGKVVGVSGKHAVYVALWDVSGFLVHPMQQVRIAPGGTPTFLFRVSSGRWALSAFEDVNGNGVLDMGAFGPKEPSGFWLAFHGWRKPRFDDVAVQVDRNTSAADIQISR
jgi:uncharacterized protein (DUF2141 family)